MMDIRGLGYVIIESTDLAKWEHFATQVLGMMVAPSISQQDSLFLKMDEYSYRFQIVAAEQDRVRVAGWEVAGPEALQEAMGEQAFEEFMQDYYRSNQWDVATTNSLKALAEERCQCDLTGLFEAWIYPR